MNMSNNFERFTVKFWLERELDMYFLIKKHKSIFNLMFIVKYSYLYDKIYEKYLIIIFFWPIFEVFRSCPLQVRALVHSFGRRFAKDSDIQVKTLFHLGSSEKGSVTYLWLLRAPFYSSSNLLFPFLKNPTSSYFMGFPSPQ